MSSSASCVTEDTTTDGETGGPDSNNGEVSLLVGRYIVGVSGSYVPDPATMTDAAKKIDSKRLAELK